MYPIKHGVRRPALRYHGGKWMIAKWIISHFPEHRIYVEPYGGAGSVLLRKEPCYSEVYNDIDGEVVSFFRILRERGPELQEALRLTPYARSEYVAAQKPTDDALESARRLVIRSFMGYGSDSIKGGSGFRANANRNGTVPAHDWKNYADCMSHLVERMRNVLIENRPALEIIAQQDGPKTLFYVDPPYVHATRTGSKRYRFEMDDAEHIKLAAVLRACQGAVVLSGYDSEMYNGLYAGWKRIEKPTFADGGRPRTEVLWIKPSLSTSEH